MKLKGAELRNFYNIRDILPTSQTTSSQNKQKNNFANIPFYQRPYKWGGILDKSSGKKSTQDKIDSINNMDSSDVPKHIHTLIEDFYNQSRVPLVDFEDIMNKTSQKDYTYFIGSTVTAHIENSNEIKNHIVDGQQRFTTLFLCQLIYFYTLRVRIRQLLKSIPDFANLTSLKGDGEFKELDKSLSHILVKHKFNHLKIEKDISREVTNCPDDHDKKVQARDKIVKMYCDQIGIRNTTINNTTALKDSYDLNLRLFDEPQDLILTYDFSMYNDILYEVCTRTIVDLNDKDCINVQFYLDGLTDNIRELMYPYINAIKGIVISFNDRLEFKTWSTTTDHAAAFSNIIKYLLTHCQTCLIQTGSIQDSYTLFEVLNDRQLALEPLDLIKNKFYQKYAEHPSNTNIAPTQIERTLMKLEEIWKNSLQTTTSWKNSMALYLGASFITGSHNFMHGEDKNIKQSIHSFLNRYRSQQYSDRNIMSEFNIFKACRIIITEFNLTKRLATQAAVKAEFNHTASKLYKAVSLANGLGAYGVMTGLINIILFHYGNKYSAFDENKFKVYLNEIKTLKTTSPQPLSTSLQDFNQYSKNISQLLLISTSAVQPPPKDLWDTQSNGPFTTPRNFSCSIVKQFNLESLEANNQPSVQSVGLTHNHTKVLERYLKKFDYSDNISNVTSRLKILFARHLQSERVQNSNLVQFTSRSPLTVSSVITEELQLDHLEPQNPKNPSSDDYFQDQSRDFHTNGLGNMFPLAPDINQKKSDICLKHSWTIITHLVKHNIPTTTGKDLKIDKTCLYEDAVELFKNNRTQKTSSGQIQKVQSTEPIDEGVPDVHFFVKRKQLLIMQFVELLKNW